MRKINITEENSLMEEIRNICKGKCLGEFTFKWISFSVDMRSPKIIKIQCFNKESY